MARKRYTPEEIVTMLRQVDVLVSQGHGVSGAIRQIGVSVITYHRWRREYGGLKTDHVKRLKELETENARLRRAVSELTLDKLILQEADRGNYWALRVGVVASSRSGGNSGYPNAMNARRSGSIVRRNEGRRGAATTRSS